MMDSLWRFVIVASLGLILGVVLGFDMIGMVLAICVYGFIYLVTGIVANWIDARKEKLEAPNGEVK